MAQAIETEVQSLLDNFTSLQANRKQGVVCSGHLPDRYLQTWFGDITIKVPKVQDKTGNGIKFNNTLVPPYLTVNQKHRRAYPLALSAWDLNGRYVSNLEIALR
ncbi:hypothetical protein [Candidatus Enterovibrio escicola]|uniref:hypothetical protein n=1 Tax=Candidatus Enterovibrio escicola TaxID=1927127 RepID=UPI0037425B2F